MPANQAKKLLQQKMRMLHILSSYRVALYLSNLSWQWMLGKEVRNRLIFERVVISDQASIFNTYTLQRKIILTLCTPVSFFETHTHARMSSKTLARPHCA
jgi:hypothetical protein